MDYLIQLVIAFLQGAGIPIVAIILCMVATDTTLIKGDILWNGYQI
ncbi:MAG: hypothetical protein ACJZ16_04825 [Methylophilaceae bacterium]